MDRSNVVTDTLYEGLAGLADWVRGCTHRKTTFPITLRPGANAAGQRAPAETYVACLACGRHLPYDWSAMRFTRRRVFPEAAGKTIHETADVNSCDA